jgi:5-methylcytosine-specific restriction endonuclease McrA
MTGTEWREARQEALERDSHECQHCSTTENLCVHHKIERLEFDDPSEAHELSNLVTLCEKCHYEAHGWEWRVPDEDAISLDPFGFANSRL